MIRIKSLALTVLLFSTQLIVPQFAVSATPNAPQNVSVREESNCDYLNGKIVVSWDYVTGASAYSVRLTREDDSSTINQSVIGERNTSTSFAGLLGGKSYIVQVRSVVVVEASTWSGSDVKVTPKTAPMAPSKPSVIAGVGKATVSWSLVKSADSGGMDVTSYVVKEINLGSSVTVAGTSSSVDFTGLAAGSSAEFVVTAVNGASSKGTTSIKSDAVTIPTVPAVMTAPTLTATGTNGELNVDWNAPASNGGDSVVTYTIKLIKGGIDLFTRVVDVLVTTLKFDGLLTADYTARVAATNGVGLSAYSLESNSLHVVKLEVVDTSTPTPTPTPTPPSNQDSGGGYFGGGGGFVPPPAPMPSISPSASPSPSASVTALPTATPTPSVMPSASPMPTPSASPTVIAPKPSVTPSASSSAIVTKTSSFAVATSSTKVTGPVNTSTLKSANSAVAIKPTSNFQAVLPAVKKGDKVTMVIKDASGKSYTVAAVTATKAGSLKLPSVKFSKVGTYTITIKVGSTTKTVKVISKK